MKDRSILTTVVTFLVTITMGWFACVVLYVPHSYQCITVDGRIVNTTHIRQNRGSMTCVTEEGETVQIISFKEVAEREIHGD